MEVVERNLLLCLRNGNTRLVHRSATLTIHKLERPKAGVLNTLTFAFEKAEGWAFQTIERR